MVPDGSLIDQYETLSTLYYALSQDYELYFPHGGRVRLHPSVVEESSAADVDYATRRAAELGLQVEVTSTLLDSRIEVIRFGPPRPARSASARPEFARPAPVS